MTARNQSINVVNAVRAAAGAEYQERIPELTRDNITQVGNALVAYEPAMNKFITTLVNKIGITVIESLMFRDPFRFLNKGRIPLGDTVEDVFFKLPVAEKFVSAGDLEDGQSVDPYKIKRPSVHVEYHKVDRSLQYTQTISRVDIEKAFQNYTRLDDFLARIIDNMYTALEYDKYIMARELFGSSKIYPKTADTTNVVNVWKGTGTGAAAVVDWTATSKELMTQLKQYIQDRLRWIKRTYNVAGIDMNTPKNRLILLITSAARAYIDTDFLAGVFNLEKVELDARIVEVDNFGSDPLGKRMVAALLDSRACKIYDKLSAEFTSIPNAKGMYWNYFLTYEGLMSYSMWGNAVPFTLDAPTE